METLSKILIVVVILVISVLSGLRAQRCHPTCQPPDCSCPRMSYPMQTRDIPQMVYFGFDDAVNIVMSSLYERIFTKKRKNPNGCRMKMSLYVSHQYTDYKKVKQFYDLGNEIGVHSVSHTVIDNDDLLRKEAKLQKENIARIGIPEGEILGWRSPFLKTAGLNQPQILKELGYEYDISLTYTRPSISSDKPWPFTMDRGWPYVCGVEPCPIRAQVENFWAVPVNSLMDHKSKYACPYADGCAVPALTEEQSYAFLWNNFMSYYNTTRTPFGLNMHAAWFYRRHNLKAMMRFLDDLMNYDDVYVVTVKQMLDWMKRPTPMRDIDTLQSWQCAESRNGARRQQRIAIPKPVKRQRPMSFFDLFRGPSPLKRQRVRVFPSRQKPRRMIRPTRKTAAPTLKTTSIATTKTTTKSTTPSPKTTKDDKTTIKIMKLPSTEKNTPKETKTTSTPTTTSTISPTTRTTSRLTTTQPSTSTVLSRQRSTYSPSTTEDTTTTTVAVSTASSSTEEPSTSPHRFTTEKTTMTETTYTPTTTIQTSSESTTQKVSTTSTVSTPTSSTLKDKLTKQTTLIKENFQISIANPKGDHAKSQVINVTTRRNPKRISTTPITTPSVTESKKIKTSFGSPISKSVAIEAAPTNLGMGGLLKSLDRKFDKKDILTSSLIGGMSLIESITSLQDMFREAKPKQNQDFPHDHDHGHLNNNDRHHSHEALTLPEISNDTTIRPTPLIPNHSRSCIQGVNCHLPDCFCQGSKIPNDIKLEDTPQMIFITLEGSINPRIYRRYQKIFKTRMNPNNCRATGTVFATDSGSSSTAVKKLSLYGAEIAMQGLHEHHYDTIDHMEQEIIHQKISLRQSNVNDVKGWKTPELKALGDDQYRLLKQYGFQYDATLLTTLPRGSRSNPWPFTLDFGYKGGCLIPECPTQRFPGLWEVQTVPVLDYKNKYECSYVDGCMFNPPSANDTEDFLWKNFMFNYKSNKAPFGIHLRHLWFSHHAYKPNVLGFRRFLDRVQALKDVYIVSISDMIEWIQNPTPVKSITDKIPWNCS